jgi:predicted lipoprotein with Yx(FWY)xxD motif
MPYVPSDTEPPLRAARTLCKARKEISMIRKLLLLPAIAVALAACSNGSTTTTAPAGGGTSTSSSSGAMSGATVQTTDNADFGTILTDADGRTLYLFEQDQGTTTACTTGCSAAWPALVADGKPTAGDGVDASLLGTAKQADGTVQVTYNGHLVYRYSGDAAAGDTNGEGIGGVWFVVSAAGEPVQQAGAGATASSSGGYVYR